MKIWRIVIDFLKKFGWTIYTNIANIISIIRILCSPIVAIMMICAFYQFMAYEKVIWPKSYSDFVFYMYLGCQVSDAIDGFLARILRIASRWGALLDRAGDKILIVPIFALMILYYLVLAFRLISFLAFPISAMLLIAVYLECMLIRYGLKGFKAQAPVGSNLRGKTKMVLQCVQSSYWMLGFLTPDIILNLYFFRLPVDPLLTHNLLINIVLIFTIVAFTMGSISGYKSLPEYRELLGYNGPK